jgi:peptidoglycan/LPS O-acetylase OafA/YrhL
MRSDETQARHRADIDGLRAIAIIPVVLEHAGAPIFPGGFVGVDVFFVISGFLITGILRREMASGSFSLTRFYERRARRLLPALLVMTLFCIPFAWAWMLPEFLANFGQSIVATLLFSNNILLALTSGYWALESAFKPLLHTWSLGVEEQFYIVFPLLLFLVWKAGKAWQLGMIAFVGILSLCSAQ